MNIYLVLINYSSLPFHGYHFMVNDNASLSLHEKYKRNANLYQQSSISCMDINVVLINTSFLFHGYQLMPFFDCMNN